MESLNPYATGNATEVDHRKGIAVTLRWIEKDYKVIFGGRRDDILQAIDEQQSLHVAPLHWECLIVQEAAKSLGKSARNETCEKNRAPEAKRTG